MYAAQEGYNVRVSDLRRYCGVDHLHFLTTPAAAGATRLTALVIGTEAQVASGHARRFRIVRRLGTGGV